MTTPPWTVLVVDDEADIRDVMTLSLEDAGYRVETAVDGREGLAACRRIRPQIVVTDIRMPRLDGIGLLEAVKAFDPDIEVIVVTAYGEVEVAIRALQRDASDFITKPVNDDALHLALRRAAERYTARRRLAEYTAFLEREVEDQARILHQDKMMSLGRLAASVVHEINNPLSGVLNYARLMQRMLERRPPDPAQAEKFREYLSLVESETDRVTEIVSNLLAFSRKSAPSFAPVNVEELVNRCALLSRHKLELAKISLSTSVQGPIPPLSGDFNQLTQCLINLILNAVDAMPEGGELGLAAAFDPEANTVALSVADTGSGISERDLGRIFEPFYTTKKQGYGVGLGLSTVFGIVESHQGQVKVESEVGRGSTFTIMLPA